MEPCESPATWQFAPHRLLREGDQPRAEREVDLAGRGRRRGADDSGDLRHLFAAARQRVDAPDLSIAERERRPIRQSLELLVGGPARP